MNQTLQEINIGLMEVARAIRRPEQLALRWRDRCAGNAPGRVVWAVLLISAAVGTALFGLVTKIPHGPQEMLREALRLPLATGGAWVLSLPALYIINTALGSRIDLSTTTFATLISMSFGSLALVASVPVIWFFGVALPYSPTIRGVIAAVVFGGVGIAMFDTCLRLFAALEPERRHRFAALWLTLVGIIGGELLLLSHGFNA